MKAMSPRIKLREKKKVIKRFAIFCFGIFLNYAGYLVFVGLQSSINIEGGVGKIKLFLTSTCSEQTIQDSFLKNFIMLLY